MVGSGLFVAASHWRNRGGTLGIRKIRRVLMTVIRSFRIEEGPQPTCVMSSPQPQATS